MYKVTIRLTDGEELTFEKPTILQAAAMVEEYHGRMVFCDIRQTEEKATEGCKDGGSGMGENHHVDVRQPEDQASSAAS